MDKDEAAALTDAAKEKEAQNKKKGFNPLWIALPLLAIAGVYGYFWFKKKQSGQESIDDYY